MGPGGPTSRQVLAWNAEGTAGLSGDSGKEGGLRTVRGTGNTRDPHPGRLHVKEMDHQLQRLTLQIALHYVAVLIQVVPPPPPPLPQPDGDLRALGVEVRVGSSGAMSRLSVVTFVRRHATLVLSLS